MLGALVVMWSGQWSARASAVVGLVFSGGLGFYSFARLAHKTNLTGNVGKLAAKSRRTLLKLGVLHE